MPLGWRSAHISRWSLTSRIVFSCLCCFSRQSNKNQINKIKSTKAWGKSPFVTSTDAYTQAHIILTYTFLNLYMHLWTFTCACSIWLLPSSFEFCVVWGMTRLFQFFLFFFVFSVSVALFFLFRFFFSPKLYFIKKKQNIKKKFLFCWL